LSHNSAEVDFHVSNIMNTDRRRRLVVVRAGDASLHPSWLEGQEPATFDLAVSYYGDDPDAFSGTTLRHFAKGGKWDGLYAFFMSNPVVLDAYDWVWLPDDDIATTTASINRLFDLVAEHALEIAQPSLTWDSYVGPFITLHNPRFQIRWTNFVEIMVPILSSAALRRIVPAFAGRHFGWGLDSVWSRWMPEPMFRAAIIDAVSVRHTRPVGKGNLSGGQAAAQKAERDELLARYGLKKKPRAVVYAGRDERGRLLRGGLRLGAALYMGWMPLRRLSYPKGQFPIRTRKLIKHVRRMAMTLPDLAPLPLPSELPTLKLDK
jgi:hypothetical protein